VFAREPRVQLFGKASGTAVAIQPEPAVFIQNHSVAGHSGLPLAPRLLQTRHTELGAAGRHVRKLVGMVFHWVIGSNGRVVAVLPRTIGEIEAAYRRDDLLAEHRVPGLV